MKLQCCGNCIYDKFDQGNTCQKCSKDCEECDGIELCAVLSFQFHLYKSKDALSVEV